MGDCLSVQYGGSEAHSQFFHRQRGDWAATVQSRDLLTSIRRFYNNTVSDAEKQQAMNLFLGNFVPQPGRPAVWELESDSFLHAGAKAFAPAAVCRCRSHACCAVRRPLALTRTPVCLCTDHSLCLPTRS
jgi:hypothetical protein